MNDPSHEPSLNVLLRLALAEKVATGLAAFVAGSILGLWLFPHLGAVAPSGWMLMRPVTAIAILTIACSLAFSVPRRKPHANRISIVMAVAVLIFGVAVLLTYVSLVPYDPVSGFRRPAPQTAICIVIAGACIALGRPSKGWPATISDVTAVALVGFVLFLFGGVIFQVMAFVRYDTTTQTSPQTVFCFALFAFVMASRRASDGTLLAILVNQGIGSQMARVMLPGILATPFLVFGAVAWLNESGLLGEAQTRAIIAPLLVLLAFAAMAMMARRANRLERQLRLQSLTDQLTGILNRRGFTVVSEYVMRNAERKEAGLTVFYFDLDGLKRSNDRLGHEAGSLIIKTFAELLLSTFRKNDVVARIGGDEFVVLATEAGPAIPDLLARLDRSVAESNATGLVAGGIFYSVGHAELKRGSTRKVEELVAEADQMMYRQKSRKAA